MAEKVILNDAEESEKVASAREAFGSLEDIYAKIAQAEAEIRENAEFAAIMDRMDFLKSSLDSKRKEVYEELKSGWQNPITHKAGFGSLSFTLPSVSYLEASGADLSQLEGVTTIEGHPVLKTTIDLEAIKVAVEEGVFTYDELLDQGILVEKVREGTITIRAKK